MNNIETKKIILQLLLLSCIIFTTHKASARCHSVPKAYPFIENIDRFFHVTIDGEAMSLYNDTTFWGGSVDFGSFDIQRGQNVDVVVKTAKKINSLEVLPHYNNVSVADKHTIIIKNMKVNDKITLVLNGDPKRGHVLHLFCNPIEKKQLSGYRYDKHTRTHYFGPGYYDLSNSYDKGRLTIHGDEKIYLAGGAVVNGCLVIDKGNGARIYGNGMMVSGNQTMVIVQNSQNCQVEGITVHGHCWHAWQTIVDHSTGIMMKNIKILNTHYASTDGIDLVSSSNCVVDSSFIRACDDCIAIKGLVNTKPADSPAIKNLSFSNLQLWNDCNNAFGIGAETHTKEVSDIKFVDSDILFSYDDPVHHEKLDERAALNICSLHGTYFHDMLFNNIRVYHCERLIGLGFKPSFWFGAISGDQSGEGGIRNIVFSNITSYKNSGSKIDNQIRLYGWFQNGTPTKLVEDITFRNVKIVGSKIVSSHDYHFDIDSSSNLVRNIKFEK